MCHSFSAPCTTVDVTDDGNLTSSCHCAVGSGFGAGRDRRLPKPPGVEFSPHMWWMKARRWQMGMPSWPLRRTRTPPCFQANHEGSLVDDRMLAELAVTCSRRVHGCAVTNFLHIPSNEGTIVSVSDQKADAAAGRCSDGAGCSVQNRKITPGFVAKQHREVVCWYLWTTPDVMEHCSWKWERKTAVVQCACWLKAKLASVLVSSETFCQLLSDPYGLRRQPDHVPMR